MNAKLLTPAEKQANKRGRIRRHTKWKAARRRELLLRELVVAAGSASAAVAETVSAEDSLDLLTGHLHRARSIATRIKRALRVSRPADRENFHPVENVPVPRPCRVLREENRGRVFPKLLNGALPHLAGGSVVEAMAAVEHNRRDLSPHAAFDFFVASSGLPWDLSAALLHDRGIIPAEFSPAEIDAIKRARSFWDTFAGARAAFHAGVNAGEFIAAHGDWAFFEADQLATLLPGLHIPRVLRRRGYLTNLVGNSWDRCLDIHSSPQASPLVRHPL